MEKLKTVLIDHDQTISASTTTLIQHVFKQTGVRISYHAMTAHELASVFPKVSSTITEFFDSIDHLNRGKPYQKTNDGFMLLRQAGFRIVIATARPKPMQEKTMEWYDRRQLLGLIDDIQTRPEGLRGQDFKVALAHELVASAIFEDAPENALSLAKNGFNVHLIRRPWNKTTAHDLIKPSPSFYQAVLKFLGSQNGQ